MCVQLLLMCIKWHGRIDWSVQRMVRVLSLNLFMKYGLEDLFHDKPPDPEHAGVQGVLKI
ncbi:MAG TPA: IS4 family transposase, partial [Gammaproteobacteria bacterium]